MAGEEARSIRLEITRSGEEIRVRPFGNRGESPDAIVLTTKLAGLGAFRSAVAAAAQEPRALLGADLELAKAIHDDVMRGSVLELCSQYREAAKPEPIVLRLDVADPELQAVPWEAMCAAVGQESFLASAGHVRVVRVAPSGELFQRREVTGSVRVLALAATAAAGVRVVQDALKEAIDDRAVEWLTPVLPAQLTLERLRDVFQPLSSPAKSPHVLHLVAHGNVDGDGRPILEMPLPDGGGVVPISAEALAGLLADLFGDTLRLVVLDACRSATPGRAGSAAQILAQRAAGAVVAHLWPVSPDVAALGNKHFYRALSAWSEKSGDVAAALHAARMQLLIGGDHVPGGASAFSPIVYLRPETAVLFEFRGRKRPPAPAAPAAPAASPALERLLRDAGAFSLLLGDDGADPREGREALQQKLAGELAGLGLPAGTPLGTVMQRYELVNGRSALDDIFGEAFEELLEDDETEPTELTRSLAELLRPGVHASLLWVPYLELALALRHGDRRIFTVQPLAGEDQPRVWMHEPGKKWERQKKGLPTNEIDFRSDFVVLRPYGGYLPRRELRGALLTEDDFIGASRLSEPPRWWNEVVREIQKRPALIVGLSVLEWRHRLILRQLFDRPPPPGSVSVLPATAHAIEERIWTEKAGGLSKVRERIDVVDHATLRGTLQTLGAAVQT